MIHTLVLVGFRGWLGVANTNANLRFFCICCASLDAVCCASCTVQGICFYFSPRVLCSSG